MRPPYCIHRTSMITAWVAKVKINHTHTNNCKHTGCSIRVNAIPVSYIQPTKSIAKPVMTNVRPVHPGSTQHTVHTYIQLMKINARRVVNVTVYSEMHQTPITALSKINRTLRSNKFKRTRCSSKANMVPVPYIQPTKINARPLLMLQCIQKAKWQMR